MDPVRLKCPAKLWLPLILLLAFRSLEEAMAAPAGQAEGQAEDAANFRIFSPELISVQDTIVIISDTGRTLSLSGTAPNPSDPAPILIEAVAAGGKVIAGKRAKCGDTVSFSTGRWNPGAYEFRLRLLDSSRQWSPKAPTHLPWYKGDVIADAKAVIESAPGQTDGTDLAELEVHHALIAEHLAYKLKIGKTSLAKTQFNLHSTLHSALMEFEEMQMAAEGKPGLPDNPNIHREFGFARLIYRDSADGAPQFARVYFPAGYPGSRKWPLVVNLSPPSPGNPYYAHDNAAWERHQSQVGTLPVIMLFPHGTGAARYTSLWERNILRWLEIAKRRLSVDEDRMYLSGMDSEKVLYLGSRHPHHFAALAASAASPTPDAGLYLDALLHTPILTRKMGKDSTVAWLLRHQRVAEPFLVKTRAASLRSAHAYWVKVERRENPIKSIVAEARAGSEATIFLNTENALSVTLSPGLSLIDPSKPARVVWNDKDVHQVDFSHGPVTLTSKGYQPSKSKKFGKWEKTPDREGPLSDLVSTPHAIVVGTQSPNPMMRAMCARVGRVLSNDWEMHRHWKPRVIPDTSISDADREHYSLILIGGPDANKVSREWADVLPLRVSGQSFVLYGQTFPAANAAAQALFPHPGNPARYVAVIAATSPAGMFLADGIPLHMDFAMVDGHAPEWKAGRNEEKIDEKLCIALGFFDTRWGYQDSLVLRGDPELRRASPLRKLPKTL